MSSSNPQLTSKIQDRASTVASTFSLPTLPPSATKSNIPGPEDGHVLPVAAATLRTMLKAERNFVTDTEPSISASLPRNNNNNVKKPQPPSSDNNNNNRGAAFRSALVREAARFVEDPDNYKGAYKRMYAVKQTTTNSDNINKEIENQRNEEEENDEKEKEESSSDEKEENSFEVINEGSMIILYDKEYEEMMRDLLLKKSDTDGHSNLQEVQNIKRSLEKNTEKDHQSFLFNQRREVEIEELKLRQHITETIYNETTDLLFSRFRIVIEDFFEEAFLENENCERRNRLQIEKIDFYHERAEIDALFISEDFLLRFEEMWKDGIVKITQVLDYCNLDTFVLKQTDAAKLLQRCGRALISRKQLGGKRWASNVGKETVTQYYQQAQEEFSSSQTSLRKRFQLHSLESFEQYCRRVILEQALSGLATIHFNANQTFIILGEYDSRRRILQEEENWVSNELMPNANSTRYDLYHVISSRLKVAIKRKFDHLPYFRNAVLTLQQKFFRPFLDGEFGATFSKNCLRRTLSEYIKEEPIRPLAKLNKALRKRIASEEGQMMTLASSTTTTRTREETNNNNHEMFSSFEKYIAPFCSAEEKARERIVRGALASLRRLYRLCFEEGSYAAVVGGRLVSEACPDEEDERWFDSKPKYEIFLRDATEVKIEAEIRQCSSVVVVGGSGAEGNIEKSSTFFLVTAINNRPSYFAYGSSCCPNFSSSSSFTNTKLCNQFLTPFEVMRPVDFQEIDWYRLRGAVDVSALIEDAFSRNKNRNAEIFARTIGQLVHRRRATTAEVHQQVLAKLRSQALERLEVEVEEWNTRWTSMLMMMQEHSYFLLNLDWQRSFTNLQEFCEQDEVVTLRYLATQNFDQYRRDVSQVLRGVHGAAIKITEEKNWMPRFVHDNYIRNNNDDEQQKSITATTTPGSVLLAITDGNKKSSSSSSSSSALNFLQQQKQLLEDKMNKRMHELYLESQRTCTPLGELLRQDQEVIIHVDTNNNNNKDDDEDAVSVTTVDVDCDNENNNDNNEQQQKAFIKITADQKPKADVNFYDDDENDEEEEKNVNFWEHLKLQYEDHQPKNTNNNNCDMYDENESELDEEEIIQRLLMMEQQDAVVHHNQGNEGKEGETVDEEDQEKKLKFYQDLYGASSDDDEGEKEYQF